MVRDTPLRLTRQDMSESCAHSAPTHLPYNSQGRAALCGWQIAKQGRRSKMTWRPFAQKNGQCGTERHPPLSRIIAPEKRVAARSEEHTSELQSLMRISYAVFCLNKKKITSSLYSIT